MKIAQVPAHTGNYTTGRGRPIDRVVIHVAEGTYNGTLAWFQNDAAKVSAHYTVGMDGRVGQSVQERDTAWHAGDLIMNQRSIGIEHEGKQNVNNFWKPSAEQLQATAELVRGICQRYNIPVNRQHIIGHNEVNPERTARKYCPGPGWPWDKFLAMVRGEDAAPVEESPRLVFLNGQALKVKKATAVNGKWYIITEDS